MPSRCIFFLSALRAWSTLLSRTRTCTPDSSRLILPDAAWSEPGVLPPLMRSRGLPSRGAIAEMRPTVYRLPALFRRRARADEASPRDSGRRWRGDKQHEASGGYSVSPTCLAIHGATIFSKILPSGHSDDRPMWPPPGLTQASLGDPECSIRSRSAIVRHAGGGGGAWRRMILTEL